MKKHLLSSLLLFILLGAQTITAKSLKEPDSENYNKGFDALQNNRIEEAFEYFTKEQEENPKNGYAWFWTSLIRANVEDYGNALTEINLALKYLPKKDKDYRSAAYSNRSSIYFTLGDYEKSIADITMAIKINPNDKELYEQRANIYCELEEYELSDKDYQKIIKLAPGDVLGYMGIGRNAKYEQRFNDAIEQFNYVIKLHPDYPSGYSFRAECYIALQQYNEAIDDIITALDIDNNQKAFQLMIQLANLSLNPLVTKLQIQAAQNPTDSYWPYRLGIVYEAAGKYREAIPHYKTSAGMIPSSMIAFRISYCYKKLYNYDSSLKYIDQAIALDSTSYDYMVVKAEILCSQNKPQEAIAELDKYISYKPDFFYGYFLRGTQKEKIGDKNSAAEDFCTSIILEPEHANAYLMRGYIYEEKGLTEAAFADYQKAIQIDTLLENPTCAYYAYLQLGKKEEAIALINRLIKQDPDNPSYYYHAACLYAKMDETEKAIEFLRMALEKGFKDFNHLDTDNDLRNIIQTPEINALIQEHKTRLEEEIKEMEKDNLPLEEQHVV